MSRLPPRAEIAFDASGVIAAPLFGDTYFSRSGGLEEAREVFLRGCGLPDAWSDREHFCVCELGFGTGLNVLALWELWRRARPPGAFLHVISIEGYLMDRADAAMALSAWPELAQLAEKLLERWPVRARGVQRLWFEDDGFALTLAVGDAQAMLPRLDARVDAWFLDGFAPSRNADMWSEAVFAQVRRLSAAGARAATYSVAGAVRRGLAQAGFEVTRAPGFGAKRERLEARLPDSPMPARLARPASALVIGGGIAGAAAARAFVRRGVAVTLIDADPCGRTKASGNPAALVMPRLDRGDTREARFHLAAWLLAAPLWADMPGDMFEAIGVEERAKSPADELRIAGLLADPPLPPDWLSAGPSGGLWHARGGMARPDRALAHLREGALLLTGAIASLIQDGGHWQARDASGTLLAQAELAVVAAGPQTERFIRPGSRLEGRAGQVTLAALGGEMPGHALAGGPYAAPFEQTRLLFGATFDPWPLEGAGPAAAASADARNLAALRDLDPALADRVCADGMGGRASLRVAARDRMPLAGPAADFHAEPAAFLALHDAPRAKGLHVLAGLGSRGFTTAFLAAELVAARAMDETLPVEAAVRDAVDPARFLARQARTRTGA